MPKGFLNLTQPTFAQTGAVRARLSLSFARGHKIQPVAAHVPKSTEELPVTFTFWHVYVAEPEGGLYRELERSVARGKTRQQTKPTEV